MIRKRPFARRRGKLDPAYVPWSTSNTIVKQGQPTTITTASYSVVVPIMIGEQMDDIVTPGFRELMQRGVFVNNPCHKYEGRLEIQPHSGVDAVNTYTGSNPPTGAVLSNTLQSFGRVPDPSNSNFPVITLHDADQCRRQAANEAEEKSHQRDLMSMVDIAEFHKTVDLIRTNLGRLDALLNGAKAFRGSALKKKLRGRDGKYRYANTPIFKEKPRSAGAKLAAAAGLHLEMQYGLIPLMSSINGLISALHKKVVPPLGQTYRGSDRVADSYSLMNSVDIPLWVGSSTSYTAEYSVDVEYYYVARAGLTTSYLPSFQGRLGMELRDLPTAIYELIPCSFVLDWFYDLGTAIEALTPIIGLHRTIVFESMIKEVSTTWRHKVIGASATNPADKINYAVYDREASITAITRTYDRTPTLSVGFPKPDFHLKSITHLVSGIALAVSTSNSRALARI